MNDFTYLTSRVGELEKTVCRLAEALNEQAGQLLNLIGIVEKVAGVESKDQEVDLTFKGDDYFRFEVEDHQNESCFMNEYYQYE